MTTHYKILDLSLGATSEQVTQAYNVLSETIQSEGCSEQDLIKLMTIKEAYGVLSSPDRRQAYEEMLAKINQATGEAVK